MTALGDYGITLAAGGELTRNVYPSASQPGRLDVLYITDDVGSVALTHRHRRRREGVPLRG